MSKHLLTFLNVLNTLCVASFLQASGTNLDLPESPESSLSGISASYSKVEAGKEGDVEILQPFAPTVLDRTLTDQGGSSSGQLPVTNLETEQSYREALACGHNDKAFENDKLVNYKKLSSHAICLLIHAYEEGHEQSREILNQITFLKLINHITKKKIGPFNIQRKTTIEDYDKLSKPQKTALSQYLRATIEELFPQISKQVQKELDSFQKYFEVDELIEKQLEEIQDNLINLKNAFKSASSMSLEDFKKIEELNKERRCLEQLQDEALDQLKQEIYQGNFPSTKVELFKSRVSDKLTLNFIAKIAISKGAAQRNPDWVNRSLQMARTAAAVSLAFVPHAGSLASTGFNLVTGIGEAGYNVYQKRKTVQYVKRFLGNNGETQTVLRLCNLIVPATVNVLAARYKNPLKLYEASPTSIEKLADYSVKLMVKSAWDHAKETSFEEGTESFQQVANFLCDGLSYYDQQASFISSTGRHISTLSKNKRKFYHLLTDSGVVTSVPIYYIKGKDSDIENHLESVIQYGFRTEDKSEEHLGSLGLRQLEEKHKSDAEKKFKGGQDEIISNRKQIKKSQEKGVAKEFFKAATEILLEELPVIVDHVIKNVN